jgi:WD40 repeat protein
MTRDDLAALERALHEAEPPDAGPARERARRTVLAQAPARRRARRAAPLVWAVVAAVIAALVVSQRDSGPAQAVERLVRDIVNVPRPTPTPASGLALPAPGRLLVRGSDGLFVVARDGRRTRLGRWDDATWSPAGLFVGATAGHTLAAVDPADGRVRWRLRPGASVSLPRWAPDGKHIAYRAGNTLRIVYGNGTHDVPAGQTMAAVAPAWRPSEQHTVAWAAADGTVTIEDADTAKVFRSYRGGAVHRLAWSGDGRRLLIARRHGGTIHDLTTGDARRLELARGEELLTAAYAPDGNRLALAVYRDGQTEIRVRGQILRSVAGHVDDLEWSPDGRWLLAGWPAAGQWLIAHASGRPHETAISIEDRFGSGARTHGWCC